MNGAFTVAAVGLTGGHGYLDGIVTIANSTGIGLIVPITDNGFLRFYQLTSGDAAQDLPAIVRPLDYADNTNEVYWKQVL